MKARAIELAGLTIGLAKVTITGAEAFLREPNSALMEPKTKSGLALAKKPTLTEVHETGWCLKATLSFRGVTS